MAALHNFIQIHNPRAKTNLTGDSDHAPGGFYAGDDSLIPTGSGVADDEEEAENMEATIRRNRIADDMWRQYQEVLHQRSLDEESDEESDEEGDDNNNDFYV